MALYWSSTTTAFNDIIEHLRMNFGFKAVTSGGPNILDVLSPELIVEIFSYLEEGDLGNVAQVCKVFKELAYTKRLWKLGEFNWFLEDVDEDLLESLIQRGITRVNIDLHSRPSSLTDIDVHNNCRNLQKLHRLYPQLVALELELNDTLPFDGVVDALRGMDFSTLIYLQLNFDPVKYLWEKNFDPITFTWKKFSLENRMVEFLGFFPNLNALGWNMSTPAVGTYLTELIDVPSDELQKVLENFKNIKKLFLNFNDGSTPFPGSQCQSDTVEWLDLISVLINAETLLTIGRGFPNVWRLGLFFCTYEGDDFAQACCRYLGHLRVLLVTYCHNIEQEDVQYIEKHAKHIKVLYKYRDKNDLSV